MGHTEAIATTAKCRVDIPPGQNRVVLLGVALQLASIRGEVLASPNVLARPAAVVSSPRHSYSLRLLRSGSEGPVLDARSSIR